MITFDAKATRVKRCPLGGGDVDLQAELLQGPAVNLGDVLPGGSDVSLRHKQAAQADVNVLQRTKIALGLAFNCAAKQG